MKIVREIKEIKKLEGVEYMDWEGFMIEVFEGYSP
jgi:hypothetical protein